MKFLSKENLKLFIIGIILGAILMTVIFLPIYFETQSRLVKLTQQPIYKTREIQKTEIAPQEKIKKLYDLNFLKTGFNLGGFIADPGDIIVFKIKNLDDKEHNLLIPDLGIKVEKILPNEEKEISFTLPNLKENVKKEYQFFSDLNFGDKEKYFGKIIINY
jgi:hypothetical protein